MNYKEKVAVVACLLVLLIGWGATTGYLLTTPKQETPCPVIVLNVTNVTKVTNVTNVTRTVVKNATSVPTQTVKASPTARPPTVSPTPVPRPTVTPTPTPASKPTALLLFFTQDGCPYCAQMAPVIQDIARTHTVQTINLTGDPTANRAIQMYNITVTPTMLVYKGSTEIARFTDVTPEATILAAMN